MLSMVLPRYDSPCGPRRDALIQVASFKITPLKRICIVEGPMDALALAELDNTIAYSIMGGNPSSEQIQHLVKQIQSLCPQVVYCVADKDNVGGMAGVQSRLAQYGTKSILTRPLDKKDVACYTLQERGQILTGGEMPCCPNRTDVVASRTLR